jgi:hypothetical protein
MLIFISSPGHAYQIEIINNKVSVAANRVPLQDLLKQIAIDNDVILRMDPAINPPITVSFKDRELEDGLKAILKPHNYALFWKNNPRLQSNPSEPAHLLAQIHVFRPGKRDQMIHINVPFDKPSTETKTVRETKVTIKNNKVYVPVTLAYREKEIQTTLLFDTGASSIILHQNVADQLQIEDFKQSVGRGVGGVQISTKATKLSYVIVGPNRKENLRADIIEYQGTADEKYNGLLGMNFLRGLKYTIDFDRQTIQWSP